MTNLLHAPRPADCAELWRIARVALTLDVTPKRVYQLVRDGRLQAVRLGPRCTRVPRASLDAYLDALARREAHRRSAPPTPPPCVHAG